MYLRRRPGKKRLILAFSIRESRIQVENYMKNRQLSLKPQDLMLLLKLSINPGLHFTYTALAEALLVSASEVHAALARIIQSRLASRDENGIHVARSAFANFLIFGAPYCFPAVVGGPTRGLPTSYAAPPLNALISQPNELPPVWPDPHGPARGITLHPLYPSVPAVAVRDPMFYESLALFDALRAGAARERELARKLLQERF